MTPFRKTTRILVVDDHPVVRLGLRQMLSQEADLEICGEAGTAAEGLELAHETSPDLVIVDISLPDRSGLELVKQLATGSDPPRIVISSMHDEMLFAERALKAGAHGYVAKEEATRDLVEAVRRVVDGDMYLSEEMTQHMLQVSAGRASKDGAGGVESLSDRELEVFERIGQGLTTREIAERLHLSVKTIESHRENVKTKLDLRNNNELIRRAVEWWLRQP